MPDDWTARLELLREIEAIGSDQATGVLAVKGISSERGEGKAHVLTAEQIEAFFVTSTPSMDAVRDGMDQLTDTIPAVSQNTKYKSQIRQSTLRRASAILTIGLVFCILIFLLLLCT